MANGSLLGKILVKLGLDSSEFKKGSDSAKKELQKIPKEAQESASKIKSAFSGLGGILAAAFSISAITNFAKSVIKTRSEIQSLQISFETLLGSKDKASAMFKELKDFANSTPMQLNDLAKGAQTMLSFGIASEKVVPILKSIGDISMGDASKFQSLTLAFSQMSSTGKLMGQDLLQMINAGFNPLAEISRKTGIGIAELKDQMSKGAISAQDITDAFISATSEGGKFYGMLDSMGGTIEGSLNKLSGAWDDMLNKIGEGTESTMTKIINLITKAVNYIGDTIPNMFKFNDWNAVQANISGDLYKSSLDKANAIGNDTGRDNGLKYLIQERDKYQKLVDDWHSTWNFVIKDLEGATHVLDSGDLGRRYIRNIETLNRAIIEYKEGLKEVQKVEEETVVAGGVNATTKQTTSSNSLADYFSKKLNDTLNGISVKSNDIIQFPEIEDLINIDLTSASGIEAQLNLIADAMANCNLMTEEGAEQARQLGLAYQFLTGNLEQTNEKLDGYKGKVKESDEAGQQLTNTLETTAVNAITSFAEAIGSALGSGDWDLESLLVKPLAQAAKSIGSILIAMGVAFGTLKSMNPIAMIAAGTALVALGAAMGAAISKMQDSYSGGSSYNTYTGGYSSQGAYSSNNIVAQTSSNVVVLTTKVSGSDLLLVQERESSRRGR